MNKKNKIRTISLGILLNAIILFPLFIQFFHALEGHKHIVCTEHTTHIHKTKIDCKICDFNFTPFTYNPAIALKNKTFIEYKTLSYNRYNYLYSSRINSSKNLRAPPYHY